MYLPCQHLPSRTPPSGSTQFFPSSSRPPVTMGRKGFEGGFPPNRLKRGKTPQEIATPNPTQNYLKRPQGPKKRLPAAAWLPSPCARATPPPEQLLGRQEAAHRAVAEAAPLAQRVQNGVRAPHPALAEGEEASPGVSPTGPGTGPTRKVHLKPWWGKGVAGKASKIAKPTNDSRKQRHRFLAGLQVACLGQPRLNTWANSSI